MRRVIALAAVSLILGSLARVGADAPQGTSPQTPAVGTPSPCVVSGDETYGYTTKNPIRVGGGDVYGPAREHTYLNGLRGPDGQVLTTRRTGSVMTAPNMSDGVLLDGYDVSYPGLATPIVLYIDEYAFAAPPAPKGLTCGPEPRLQPPGPDPFATQRQVIETAVLWGGAHEIAPVPIDPDGPVVHGVAFDHFRLVARAAHAAAAAGKPLNPAALPRELSQRVLVVAYPLSCDGQPVLPVAIDLAGLVNGQPRSVNRLGDYAKAEGLSQQLPGAQLPDGAIGASFQLGYLRVNDVVKITYGAVACPGQGTEISLPTKFTQAHPVRTEAPRLPEGIALSNPPQSVNIQVLVDPDGVAHRPEYVSGVFALSDAATQAVLSWKIDPPRINGAPLLIPLTVPVRFVQPPHFPQ